MCYFITVGVPESRAELLEQGVPRGLHVEPVANPSALRQMGTGLRTYLLTSGGCSCDLFGEPPAGSDEPAAARRQAKQGRRRQRHEKMGWSAAKIGRAARQRRTARQTEPVAGLRGDVQRFLGELAAKAGELAVVVHWYEGDVEHSRPVFKDREVVPPGVALGGRLRLRADEIVRIKAPP